jgi:hypothetical protein
MKKTTSLIIIILFFTVYGLRGQAKVAYTYDASGNRTSKIIILPVSNKSIKDTTSHSDAELSKQFSEMENNFEFEKLSEGKIKVYPNPTEGAIMLRIENIHNFEGTSFQLYNSSGNLIKTGTINSDLLGLDLSGNSPGLYILKISRQEEKLEFKIIKK